MPNTPQVKFNFINNNVEESTPLKGVSMVLARTTKGPANDPSTLITSIAQFHRVFGQEIVPDGSVSNIEKALKGGSKLRIIRVLGAGYKKGEVGTLLTIETKGHKYTLTLSTRGYGDPIGSGDSYTVKTIQNGTDLLYNVIDADGSTVLEAGTIFSYLNHDDLNPTSVDYLALSQFIQNNTYFDVTVTDTASEVQSEVSTENMLLTLAKVDGTDNDLVVTPTEELTGTLGNAGGTPVGVDWKQSMDAILDYTDVYNIMISHLALHIPSLSEQTEIHKAMKDLVDELDEYRYFIEIPKTCKTLKAIVDWKKGITNAIGHSKWVSYYAGGLKYANNYGIVSESDISGTVLGLADASATSYGYNYSFSGMNRGIVPDAHGPVCPNFGSPARTKELNELAQNCINIFVIRDTTTMGKQTMLWNGFTDQVKQDSFRFLGNTGLVLNIKKTLRPILESYLEEPNIWDTWKAIYHRVKPIIRGWVDDEALTDPVWQGDQDATSWNDLKINTEAACRQGHYHVRFSFKDIVALQDITLDVVIEQSSKSVSITTEDTNSSNS